MGPYLRDECADVGEVVVHTVVLQGTGLEDQGDHVEARGLAEAWGGRGAVEEGAHERQGQVVARQTRPRPEEREREG